MTQLKFYTEGFDHPLLKDIPLVLLIHGILRDFKTHPDELSPWELRFSDYWQQSSDYLVLSSLEECDIVVLPYDWSWVRGHHWLPKARSDVSQAIAQLSHSLYGKAIAHDKPAIAFFSGDRSHEAIPFSKATIFRQSIYQSRRSDREFAFPAFSEDLMQQVDTLNGSDYRSEKNAQLVIRPKSEVPTVGFCGLATLPSFKNRLGDLLYHSLMLVTQGYPDVSPHKGAKLRVQAIEKLQQTPGINTNFILRNQSVFFNASLSNEQKKNVRHDYIQNVLESDYILCCRGSGNFSLRIYEALCLGRIPVLINTDGCLPYAFEIDWKRYCVWVDEKEFEKLPQKIVDFHNSQSPESFEALQLQSRELWESRLSPRGFFSNLSRHFADLF